MGWIIQYHEELEKLGSFEEYKRFYDIAKGIIKFNNFKTPKEPKEPKIKTKRQIKHACNIGNCKNILVEHHKDLVEDPERLSTEFIVKITGCKCNRHKKVYQ